MVKDNKHKSWLQFVKKILEIPAGLSKEDLITFRSAASQQFPALVNLIEEYIRLAERSDTDVTVYGERARRAREQAQSEEAAQMHLFDLLRERRLFPQNSDLVEFAERILPDMRTYRYDKMSKSDIAARVLEYLETLDARRKSELESSMRNAVKKGTPRTAERKSFLSTWEKIIKGIQL